MGGPGFGESWQIDDATSYLLPKNTPFPKMG